MARVFGAPDDTLPTDSAEREAGVNALAVSIFNSAHASGSPITFDEARTLARQEADSVPPRTEPTPAPGAEALVADEPAPASVMAPPQPSAQQVQSASYQAHRQRVKRYAERTGMTYDEADKALREGYAAAGITFTPGKPLAGTGTGGLPSVTDYAVAGDASGLAGKAFDRRMEDQRQRQENVRRRGMLAGSSPTANAVNLFNTLPPEWQNVVAAGRLTPNLTQTGVTPLGVDAARAGNSSEDKIRMLQLDIDARQAEADAARTQQQAQWDEQWRRQEAQRQEDQRQREEERGFDAEFKREEMEFRRGEAEAQRNSDERRATAQNETQRDIATINRPDPQAQMSLSVNEERRKSRDNLQNTNPGLYNLMLGYIDHPAAITFLRDTIAPSADNGWLGEGFNDSAVRRMDDNLLAIANQAASMGIPDSPLWDPAVRAEIINRYGRNSGWSGGRGGWWGSGQVAPSQLTPRPDAG